MMCVYWVSIKCLLIFQAPPAMGRAELKELLLNVGSIVNVCTFKIYVYIYNCNYVKWQVDWLWIEQWIIAGKS